MNFRKVLGIPHDADERAVKRAYSALIKQYRPDTHPAEFAQVREAYEAAMQALRHRRHWEEEEERDFTGAQPVAEAFADARPSGTRTAPVAEASADQEFDRVLTEPPVLTLPDAAPEGEISGHRDFERVVTKPPVLPPLDIPPVEADVETCVVLGDAETLEAMLAEFEAHAGTASEEEQLQRYRAHARRLAEWPLDFQMDYEQGLLSWLLFSDNPSLLVFQEANLRHGWESCSMDIMRTYGDGARLRHAVLQQLAEIFAAARKARNPFLLLDGAVYRRFPVDDHYSALRAQEQSAAWQLACERAGLAQLLPRLAYAEDRKWRVYWVDVMAGLGAAWVAWLLLDVDPTPFMWLKVLLVGAASLPVVVVVRGAVLWILAKLRPITSRFAAWRKSSPHLTHALGWAAFVALSVTTLFISAAAPPDMPALFILPGLFGLGILCFMVWYLYCTLAKVEIAATHQVLRLVRFAAWLRRVLARA